MKVWPFFVTKCNMNRSLLAVILAFSTSALFAEDMVADVQTDFFGSSAALESLSTTRKQALPVLPILASPDATVAIDYFYDANCEDCARMSKALYDRLNKAYPIQIVFHPVPTDQASFDFGLADLILFASEPRLFELHHFGTMAGLIAGKQYDADDLLSGVLSVSDNPEIIVGRFANYESWSTGLSTSADLVGQLGIKQLPAIVVSGELYQGFPGDAEFDRMLINKLGGHLIDR
jgi:hypothetical protein